MEPSAVRFRLAVDLPGPAMETVLDRLWPLAPGGMEVQDGETLPAADLPAPPAGTVRLLSFHALAEGPGAVARAATTLAELAAAGLPVAPYRVWGGRVADAEWRDRYLAYFRPSRAGQRLWVRPPWEELPPEAGEAPQVIIDPGGAFGTGTHETTRLCLSALERAAPPAAPAPARPPTLLDAGTGTGILAIAGYRLGYRGIVATDTDPEALAAAALNVERNGLPAGAIRFLSALPAAEFDTVVANIDAAVLRSLAFELAPRVAAGGRLFLSGVLAGEAAAVAASYDGQGLRREGDAAREGDWVLLAFRRSP